MSVATFRNDDERKSWALLAEKFYAMRHRVKPMRAREDLADDWGVSFWTLHNWYKGRRKDLHGQIRDRVDAGIIGTLFAEHQSLNHELQMLLQRGVGRGEVEISEIEADLEKVRASLRGLVGNKRAPSSSSRGREC